MHIGESALGEKSEKEGGEKVRPFINESREENPHHTPSSKKNPAHRKKKERKKRSL